VVRDGCASFTITHTRAYMSSVEPFEVNIIDLIIIAFLHRIMERPGLHDAAHDGDVISAVL